MQAPADFSRDVVVALTTIGSTDDGEAFARALVEREVIACANLIPAITSVYRWKGEVTTDREQLVIMKLRRNQVSALKEAMTALHSYDVPELLVLDVSDGLGAYLSWVRGASSA